MKMFQKFYTTKMSGNAKSLQKRFSKIRAGKSKAARFMAMIMTVAILAATLGGAAVLAAIGEDGLEHWDKNEIYFLDGVQFSVNVSGKNVPAWVWEDIAGEDGKIDVVMKRFQIRDTNGRISEDFVIELVGTIGVTKMSSNMRTGNLLGIGRGRIPDNVDKHSDNPYHAEISFVEFNNEGYAGYRQSGVAKLVTENSGKYKNAVINFSIDKNQSILSADLRCFISDKNDNPGERNFDKIEMSSNSISYIGNFEKEYMDILFNGTDTNHYFTTFEKDYKNKTVSGIDILVESATTDGIIINTDITLPQAKKIEIKVYNNNGRVVSDAMSSQGMLQGMGINLEEAFNRPIQNEYLLLPTRIYSITDKVYIDVPENHFVKGDVYRICAVVVDNNFKILYRFQEYVTIQ